MRVDEKTTYIIESLLEAASYKNIDDCNGEAGSIAHNILKELGYTDETIEELQKGRGLLWWKE